MYVFGESLEEWNRHILRLMAEGSQTLTAIDKCLTRIPDMRTKILYNVYWIICKSRLIYGAEIWAKKRS
jgi:hypothetical protein